MTLVTFCVSCYDATLLVPISQSYPIETACEIGIRIDFLIFVFT